jgi:hypothetical protein
MPKLLYITPFLLALGLCNTEDSSVSEECLFPRKFGLPTHVLKVPVQVYPNKSLYSIGDTLKVIVNLSDSIEDINRDKVYYMPGFPFDGGVRLWRFTEGTTWDYGFVHNKVHIDTVYKPKPRLGGREHYIYFDFVESDHRYQFEMYIVFESPGRYIFQMEDFIDRYPNELYYSFNYEFEGRCPTMGFRVSKVLEGEDYLEEFIDELLYIDKELYYDNWASIEKGTSFDKLFTPGGLFWEWTATYCFEVE